MILQHVNIKIFVDGELQVDPAGFIVVFHKWVSEQSLDDMLIDVADYRHVPSGPGVLLIGLEADYSMDNADNRFALRYNRKAPLQGSNSDRFSQALSSAVKACQNLEAHFSDDGPLKFSRNELEIFINDRALAPNTPETYEACKPELQSFFETAFGHSDFTMEHRSDPRRRFNVAVHATTPFDLDAILSNL